MPETDTLSVMPHSTEAEKAVLGAAFFSYEALNTLIDGLKPDDMYENVHKEIFANILDYHEENPSFNLEYASFKEFLDSKRKLEDCGGTYYLKSIIGNAPTVSNLENYITIVQKNSIRRKMILLSDEIKARAADTANEVYAEIDGLSGKFVDLSARFSRGGGYLNLPEKLKSMTELMYESIENNVRNVGILSGFYVLDSRTNGFRPGQLVVISGRPGSGKTAFALSLMLKMEGQEKTVLIKNDNGEIEKIKKKIKTAFFSYEMGYEEVINRLLANISGVSFKNIQTNNLKTGSEEMSYLDGAFSKLAEMDLKLYYHPWMSISDLSNEMRRLCREDRVDVVFIDYLSLINMDKMGTKIPLYERIAVLTRGLKMIAGELGITIICLAQLNREADKGKPNLSNLSDSSSIEKDADTVIFLNDPNKNEKNDETADDSGSRVAPEVQYAGRNQKSRDIEVIVAKQRNGSVGTGIVSFIPEIITFCNKEEST